MYGASGGMIRGMWIRRAVCLMALTVVLVGCRDASVVGLGGAVTDAVVDFGGAATHAVVTDAAAFDRWAFTISARVKLRQHCEPQVFVNRGARSELFTLYLYKGIRETMDTVDRHLLEAMGLDT